MRAPSIGVFDSGFGGLTVLRSMLPLIPAHYLYLGDTARLPYGAKSRATIARYAVESARFLEARGAEFLVIACNTATALALEEIRAAVSVPVLGVIKPGAAAALAHASIQRGDTLVLATAATVQSHAYRDACAQLGIRALEMPCPLLVPLVEEGWIHHPVTREVIRIYLREALQNGSPNTVLLGCTHYPLLADEITSALRELGSAAAVIDSAEATAQAAAAIMNPHIPIGGGELPATFECFATDSVEKFQRLGTLFLGRPIEHVQHLNLGG